MGGRKAPPTNLIKEMEHKKRVWLAVMALIILAALASAQDFDSFTLGDLGLSFIDVFLGWGADILENWGILVMALITLLIFICLVLFALYISGWGS